MKKQSVYFVEEREIDIKTMLWQAAKQWRIILIVALLSAILVCSLNYKADVASAQAAINNQIAAANAPEVTVESVSAQLPDERFDMVWNTVRYREYYQNKQAYMENSIWMNLNAYAIDVVYLDYQVSGESSSNVIAWASQHLLTKEFAQLVADEMGSEIDPMYITELLSVVGGDGANSFRVRVCAGSAEECNKLAACVDLILEDAMLSVCGANTFVELANKEESMITDANLAGLQVACISELNNVLSTYNGYDSSLTELERLLVQLILADRADGVSMIPEDKVVTEEKAPVEIDTTIHVKPSIVMFVVGFIAGAVFAYAVMMLLYTVSKKIHGTDEVQYLFGISVLGTMNVAAIGKKRVFGAVDKWVDTLFNGKKYQLTYAEELEMIASKIEVLCEQKNQKAIYVFGSDLHRIPEKCMEDLTKKLHNKGITMTYGRGITYDVASLQTATEIGYAVVFEVDEQTQCEEFVKELNLCRQSGIEVLGATLARF